MVDIASNYPKLGFELVNWGFSVGLRKTFQFIRVLDKTEWLCVARLQEMTANEVITALDLLEYSRSSFCGICDLDLITLDRLLNLQKEQEKLINRIKVAIPDWQDASKLTLRDAIRRFWPYQRLREFQEHPEE